MCSRSKKRSGCSKKKSSKNAALKLTPKPCMVQMHNMSPQDIVPYFKASIFTPVNIPNAKSQKSKKAKEPKEPKKSKKAKEPKEPKKSKKAKEPKEPKKSKEKKMTEKMIISLTDMSIKNAKETPPPSTPPTSTRKSSRLSKASVEEEAKKKAFLARLGLVDHETAKSRILEQNCPQLQAARWAEIRKLQPLIFNKNQALAKKLLRARRAKMTKSMKSTSTTSRKRGRPAKNKNNTNQKKTNEPGISSPTITTMVIRQNLNSEIAPSETPPEIDFYPKTAENHQVNSIQTLVPAVTSSYPKTPLGLSYSTEKTPQPSSIYSSRGNTELSLMNPWVTAEVSRALPLTRYEKLEILQCFLADFIEIPAPLPNIEYITID